MASPSQQRRQEEKEARREQLLDAAERVLGEKGFEGVVLADVAAASRVSRALLYSYFRDKTDLFHAVSVRASDELRERFGRAVLSGRTGLERIYNLGRAYVAFSQERPILFEAVARTEASEVDADDEPRPYALAALEASREVLSLLAMMVEQGQADGSVRRSVGDAHAAAIALWGVVHGVSQVTAHRKGLVQATGVEPETVHDLTFALLDAALGGPEPTAE